jgi:hypothetical protein
MDLQPSAPVASASLFSSPTQLQMNGDPSLSLESLDDICQGETACNSNQKIPLPNLSSSTRAGFGIDHRSELFSASSAGTWSPGIANERNRSSAGPYFSPNKIAYRSPGSAGGTDSSPRVLPSLPPPGSCTFQGLLQRCGLGSGTALDRYSKTYQQDFYIRPATSAGITQKIRNLDEILRNLEHHSISRKFPFYDAKDRTESISKKRQHWPDPDVVQDTSSELLLRSADHCSGVVGASMISDGLTNITKSISRMEFKVQMEKLAGCIDDRWPRNKRVEKTETTDYKTLASSPCAAEPVSVRMSVDHLPVKDMPGQPAHGKVSNASAASTQILEIMMRNITRLERRLAKRDKSKQTKQKVRVNIQYNLQG